MTNLEKVNSLLEMLRSTESIQLKDEKHGDRILMISTFEGGDRKKIKAELMSAFQLDEKPNK